LVSKGNYVSISPMSPAPDPEPCPIARSLDVVGDRWSFLILRDVFYGVRRFDALQKRLGISKKVLSGRLSSLVESGILKRIAYQQRPVRHEYRPTEMARDFFPVLLAMTAWGNRWLLEPGASTMQIKHIECGSFTESVSSCKCCGKPLRPGNIKALLHQRCSADVERPTHDQGGNVGE